MGLVLAAVTFAEVMKWIGYILIALLCLMFMIVVHEFGHFVVGRLLGFKVDEFAVGFGPAILKHKSKKSGIQFSLMCLPLGGFCAFHGETADDDCEPTKDDFNYHKPWKRILVFIAGAAFNLLSAVVLCTIFFMAYGDMMPTVVNAYQFEDSALVQQLQEGDMIIAVDGKSLYNTAVPNDLQQRIQKYTDKMTVTIVRNGEQMDVEICIGEYVSKNSDGETVKANGIGISVKYQEYKFGFIESLGRSFVFIAKLFGTIFTAIGGVITGVLGIGETMGGTVTAIEQIAQISQIGFRGVLFAVCALSANIAIMNLLPIPALDGAHVVFTAIEWVRGKPLNRKVENIIHTVGLICLFLLAIVLDVVHFIS